MIPTQARILSIDATGFRIVYVSYQKYLPLISVPMQFFQIITMLSYTLIKSGQKAGQMKRLSPFGHNSTKAICLLIDICWVISYLKQKEQHCRD